MSILLGHERVVDLDHLDPELQGLVVDQLQVSEHLGRVLVVGVWRKQDKNHHKAGSVITSGVEYLEALL